MNRAARRRVQATECNQVLSIALPSGDVVTDRPDDVARRLQAHLEATDPETEKRIAIRAAAHAWSKKPQRKVTAKERRTPPEPVILPPGRMTLEGLMSAPLREEHRT